MRFPLKEYLKNPFLRFILVGTGLYLMWYVLYEYYLNPQTLADEYIIDNLTGISQGILSFLGYETVTESTASGLRNYIGINGFLKLHIGAPCDGFALLILFFSFIVAFPGPSIHKIWYIPVGLLLIHLINALRVVALVLIVKANPEWLSFNHDYTFTILVYAFVFLLWWIWVNKFSPLKKQAASTPQ